MKILDSKLLEPRGALTLPILLFLGIGIATGSGILFLLERWRIQARIQLHLDLCVAERAKELQKTAQEIETLNHRLQEIRRLREILGWIPGAPAVSEAIAEAAVTAVTLPQEALRIRWMGLLLQACPPGGFATPQVRPLIRPDFWLRTPERDRWGPGLLALQNPLRREPTQTLLVQARFRSRRSAAALQFSRDAPETEASPSETGPRIHWTQPAFLLGNRGPF